MSQKPRKKPQQPEPWDPDSGERPLLGAIDEAALDIPSRQTLIMLGVLCVSTLVMWAAGRAACNYHVPGEGLTPRVVTLEEKTRNPKDVGIELGQALSGADFDTAKMLIGPGAEPLIEDAKKCGACALEKAAAPSLLSVGEVISASRSEAYVAVKTIGGPAGEVERVFLLSRDTGRPIPWRVTRQLPGRDAVAPLEGALSPMEATAARQPQRPDRPMANPHTIPPGSARDGMNVPLRGEPPVGAASPATPPASPAPGTPNPGAAAAQTPPGALVRPQPAPLGATSPRPAPAPTEAH